MNNDSYTIPGEAPVTVQLRFNMDFAALVAEEQLDSAVFLVDEQVLKFHPDKFRELRVLSVKSGEAAKEFSYVMELAEQLLAMKVQRNDKLVGVGGGVVCDITGFLGATYKRGISFGFVPTTLLAMVDASLGGKNGINIGNHKNMLGTVAQPAFIAYDHSFLSSLPETEWSNGFAEIIKHACIRDAALFSELEERDIAFYRDNPGRLAELIARNVRIKSVIVSEDVNENGDRKLLNFGHTIGHAVEKLQQTDHGKAISIGMYRDALLSQATGPFREADRIAAVLLRYHLPVHYNGHADELMHYIANDKKSLSDNSIDYIVLEKIGKGVIKNISLQQLEILLKEQHEPDQHIQIRT